MNIAPPHPAFVDLARSLVPAGTKGIPPHVGPMALGDIGAQGWNVLTGDLTFPVLTLSDSALRRNSAAMNAFLTEHGISLAPHGKTTMSPQLFARQVGDGAWGITVSTVQHVAVCQSFGFRRLIVANQLVGRAEIAALFTLLVSDPGLEVYVLVDSLDGLRRLAVGADDATHRLNLLIEVGVPGGRTGCRDDELALAIARAAVTAGFPLRGVEAFEGILSETASVDAFLDRIIRTARLVDEERLFAPGQEILLTAGGSAFYDRVAARLKTDTGLSAPVRVVARSGCYLTHDSGAYRKAFADLCARSHALADDAYVPALTVFALVQSRPDADKAIVTLGRRDVGTDAGMPVPQTVFRPGRDTRPQSVGAGYVLTGINDQHGHLSIPADCDLSVGDIVGFGISHPCTTFDKWQVVFVTDDNFAVTDAIKTCF